MDTPLVSIIIPIRTGENIKNIISFIRSSTYKNYEIILVEENAERSNQRNIGIKWAKGKYLLILDSDQCPHPLLIADSVYRMQFNDALYIPETIMTKGLFAYIRNWERQFYNCTPIDCVRFVKRENCPLFDETMAGPEDSDWDRQIKGVKGISGYPVFHYDNISFIDYFRKKAYYAKSMNRFAEKHPNDKVLNFWWRCFGVFFEHRKWKWFLSRPDLAIAVIGIIFIRGLIFKLVTLNIGRGNHTAS